VLSHQCHDAENVEEDGLDVSVDVRPEVGAERAEDDDDRDHHRQILPSFKHGSCGRHELPPKYS